MSNFILNNENAIYYECGYSCDNAYYIKIGSNSFFVTDPRYEIEAKSLVNEAEVLISDTSLSDVVCSLFKKFSIRDIDYDPTQFTVSELSSLDCGVNFVKKPGFSKIKRAIKTQKEIESLRYASNLGSLSFDKFASFVSENGNKMSEKELFFNTNMIFQNRGLSELSFSPIVAVNQNAAKAHAIPTDDLLNLGDILLLDAGVKYNRYCSDRTRVVEFKDGFKFDKEQKFSNSKREDIYNIVKEAQLEAIKSIKPGVAAKDVDFAARDVINRYGYGSKFIHSTGHGVGLDIHEFPIISSRSSDILQEGMVFSVEPGIYIDGEFGVRIEDVVVVTKDGCEIL